MSDNFDVAIIGAGIAGASMAAELGAHARVIVLEAEDTPGYHSTGRSAAFWEECYGGPGLVPLTLASGEYLREGGYLSKRGALYLARGQDEAEVTGFVDRFAKSGAKFERIERAQLETIVPGLRADWDRAIWEPGCADIDVAALHAHYLSSARKFGVEIRCRARVAGLAHDGDWRISLEDGYQLRATTLVNAAGAWADEIATMAGVAPIGIQPYRRTVAQLRVDPPPPDDLPLCLDISGSFYFKPESGRLWLSPHDETPSLPIDAAPEEIDVARAIDRLQHVTEWNVQAVERKWAGLRSFAPDRLPVYGRDPDQPEFFWCAGQGGFGIQTSPAGARLSAQLLLGLPRDAMTLGIDAENFVPFRFC